MEKIKYNVALVGAESQDLQFGFDDLYEVREFMDFIFKHQAEDMSLTVSMKKYEEEEGEEENGSTE